MGAASRVRTSAAAVLVGACGPVSGVPLGVDPADAGSSSDSSGDAWQDGGSGGDACTLPTLDELTAGQLYIDAGPFPDVARGQGRQLRLATAPAGVTEVVEACVTWSIAPPGGGVAAGASLGATIGATGYLRIDDDAEIGASVVVTADVEDGRRVLELEVMIYEPVVSPILGVWSETLRLPCDGGDPFAPVNPVGELMFFDNSDFRVTWTPFEAYVDYWGSFVHDPASGAITLSITGGNATPSDFDGVGFATVTGAGALELAEMFLGSAPGRTPSPACGHRFE
jgi:hypothetical protein